MVSFNCGANQSQHTRYNARPSNKRVTPQEPSERPARRTRIEPDASSHTSKKSILGKHKQGTTPPQTDSGIQTGNPFRLGRPASQAAFNSSRTASKNSPPPEKRSRLEPPISENRPFKLRRSPSFANLAELLERLHLS